MMVTSSCPSSPFSPSFIQLFSRFLRAEGIVNHLWQMSLDDEKKDFPRHYFNLCSSSQITQRHGLLAVTSFSSSSSSCSSSFSSSSFSSSSTSSSPHNNIALENYCSFFLHTTCHPYLHSSIGTFVLFIEKITTPLPNQSSSPSSPPPLLPSSPKQLEQIFKEFLNILLCSSFEINDLIAPMFHDIFTNANITNPQDQIKLFLKFYISSFICNCLEQPQVVLSLPLSSEVIFLCSFFATILRMAVNLPSSSPSSPSPSSVSNNTELLIKKLTKIARDKIEMICGYILWGKWENEVDEGYRNFFFPLWEYYHCPCHRSSYRSTCSMKEPSLLESYFYFDSFLREKKEELLKEIIKESKMGEWSLEVEVVKELVEWMGALGKEEMTITAYSK